LAAWRAAQGQRAPSHQTCRYTSAPEAHAEILRRRRSHRLCATKAYGLKLGSACPRQGRWRPKPSFFCRKRRWRNYCSKLRRR
jgi:hypothetical protein